MTLQNSYTVRIATQERPCFVCNKFTTTVLTSEDGASDWFYVCMPHLADTSFCRVVGLPAQAPPSPKSSKNKNDKAKTDNPAENNSVTSFVSSVSSVASGLWNTIASKKDEEEPNALEEKKGDKKQDNDNDNDANTDKAKKPNTLPGSFSALPAGAPSPVITPTKPKYILHRDIFYLREATFKKKQQKKQAAERLMNLEFPAVPKTAPR
jgi:AAA-ATPase Vps4-associated protein 1